MKSSRNFWYYFGIGAMVFGVGAIIYSVVSGETYVLGKFVVVLVIGITVFIRELKAKREVTTDQEKPKLHNGD